MKHLIFFSIGISCMLAGCGKQESSDREVPKAEMPAKTTVNVGDSYADVIEKLGKPNIETVTKSSRVLIYDQIELMLQSNAVIKVYDYRGE